MITKTATIFLGSMFALILSAGTGQNSDGSVHLPADFRQETEGHFNPGHWQFASQRNELAPEYSFDENILYRNKPTLTLSGAGKEHANGCWYQIFNIIPGNHYKITVHYKTTQVQEPLRSVLTRVIWMDEDNKKVGQPEYPETLRDRSPDDWNKIQQIYQVPPGAVMARVELVYRWDADGMVRFGDFSFTETDEPPARLVRLATIHHRPRNSKGPKDNLEQFAGLIAEAGAQKADIVCLPEFMTLVGTGLNYISASEPVPGPTTKFLGEMARRHNLYIVAGIGETDGDVVYNTAVLINRNGELAGRYRKVSLPREEIEGGVTPGSSLPVFDTDFGRIGMMICWDVTFPEVARTLAMKGAEVILMPIWGGNLTLAMARAIENQVYLVSSSYGMRSAIFDLEGHILEEADENNPVAISEVDLNKQMLWPWLGDFKNRIPREIPSIKATDLNSP